MDRSIKYEPLVTLGNILSIIAMIGTLIGLYITHERRITILEYNQISMREQLGLMTIVNAKAMDNQNTLTKSLDRLTVLFEERSQRKQ